jgi:hypothetical protein
MRVTDTTAPYKINPILNLVSEIAELEAYMMIIKKTLL